jgi:hypothetical protein
MSDTRRKVTRDGQVYSDSTYVGQIWKVGREWRNDLCGDLWPSQFEAIQSLFRIFYRSAA